MTEWRGEEGVTGDDLLRPNDFVWNRAFHNSICNNNNNNNLNGKRDHESNQQRAPAAFHPLSVINTLHYTTAPYYQYHRLYHFDRYRYLSIKHQA